MLADLFPFWVESSALNVYSCCVVLDQCSLSTVGLEKVFPLCVHVDRFHCDSYIGFWVLY